MEFFKKIFTSETKAPTQDEIFKKYGVDNQRSLDEALEAEYQASLKSEGTSLSHEVLDTVKPNTNHQDESAQKVSQ